MSNKPDKSSFLRAESELILDLVSKWAYMVAY